MTPEKLYKTANAILTAIADEKTAAAVRRDPLYWTACGRADLEAVAELLADAAAGLDKTAGRGNAAAVLKRVIKNAPANFSGIYKDTADGFFYATDGRRAFRFSSDFPAVPHAEDGPRGVGRVFVEGVEAADLPTVATVKKYIAEKGLKRGRFCPDTCYPVGPAFFNAFLLLDLLEFFGGDCSASFAADHNGAAGPFSALVAKGPAGDAVLLPVRVPQV